MIAKSFQKICCKDIEILKETMLIRYIYNQVPLVGKFLISKWKTKKISFNYGLLCGAVFFCLCAVIILVDLMRN